MSKYFLFLTVLLALSVHSQELPKIELGKAEDHAIYDEDLLPPSFHAQRRQELRDRMAENSVAVLFANPVRNRSNDVDFEYHQDPDFYYLSGLNEPNAVLFVFKEEHIVNGRMTNEVLFLQKRIAKFELWNGKRLGVEGGEEILKFQLAVNGDEFKNTKGLFENIQHVYALRPERDVRNAEDDDADLYSLVETFDKKLEQEQVHVVTRPLVDHLSAMREIKTQEELVLIRQAINITCEAQRELMKALQPGMKEFETEAIVEFIFKRNGAEYPGFPTIHGSGPNSCILHYVSNRRPMESKDLLVSDIGAEYHGYTADVTRTIPANGVYSTEERAIYELVLKAQNAGIEKAREGNEFSAPHKAAYKTIQEGLFVLGLIKKSDEVRNYFMHGTSHYLGLDVHDAGTYGPLQVNSIITVEPGIYIAEGSDCDPKWWNIGVRIEDDILITTGDPEILSASVPRTIVEIEELMKEGSVLSPNDDQ